MCASLSVEVEVFQISRVILGFICYELGRRHMTGVLSLRLLVRPVASFPSPVGLLVSLYSNPSSDNCVFIFTRPPSAEDDGGVSASFS